MTDWLPHAALEGLLGAYALNAVDDADAVAIAAHLEECSTCRAEVADHRDVVAMLDTAGRDDLRGM